MSTLALSVKFSLFVFVFIFANALALRAEPLASLKRVGLNLELNSKGKSGLGMDVYQLRVKTDQFEAIDIFDLSDPKRIVVDFLGVKRSFQKSLNVENNPAIKTIRFGKHPDKLRVVLDIEDVQRTSYSWTQSKDALVMSIRAKPSEKRVIALNRGVDTLPKEPIAEQEASNSMMARLKEPKILDTSRLNREPIVTQPVKIEKDKATIKEKAEIEIPNIPSTEPARAVFIKKERFKSKEQFIEKEPSKEIPAKEVITKPEVNEAQTQLETIRLPMPSRDDLERDNQRIRSISFEYLPPNNVPALRVELNAKPEFSLIKKSPLEYQLQIENCSSGGEHNLLPYFPPQDFKGMLGLKSEEVGEQMQLNIRVEPKTRVNSFVRENTIYIRAIPIG